MSEQPTYEGVIDEVAAAFRAAYLDRPGDAGALLHAKTIAGSAMAALLADQAAHTTTVRLDIKPTLGDEDIEAIAAEVGVWTHKARDVINAALARQLDLTEAPAVRAPITPAEVAAIPAAAADAARSLLDEAITEHLTEAELAYDEGEHYSPHPISIEADARAILAAARPLLDTDDNALDRDLEGCPFCDIARGRGPATIVYEWPDAIAFVPLNPVTPGHVLVVPRTHVMEFTQEPWVSAMTMRRAAELAVTLDPIAEYNVITSAGPHATQTIDHLHLHLVPRREGDDLALPWSPAPVPVTATKCAQCGMRLGHVNYRGHVIGWGCADGEHYDERLQLAPQLARALVDLVDRCVADDDEAPIEAMIEAIATDHRVVPDAGPAIADLVAATAPVVAQLLRRTHREAAP